MLSSRDAFGTPCRADAIVPCSAAIFIIRVRRTPVCSKAYSRPGFARQARHVEQRACRASAAKCGSTHRSGRRFSIIAASWRPASMRGQSTSNVNKEPGAGLEDCKRSRRADRAWWCRACTHASARRHRASRPCGASSNSFRIGCARAAHPPFIRMPLFARMCYRGDLLSSPYAPRLGGLADCDSEPPASVPTKRRTQARRDCAPRTVPPCCTAGDDGRHNRFHVWPRRFAEERSVRSARVSPRLGTAKHGARRGAVDYGM